MRSRHLASRCLAAAFANLDELGSHVVRSFRGSIARPAHSLSTLHRMGCPTPCKTCFWLDALPLPGRTEVLLGTTDRFRLCVYKASPRSQAFLAHQDPTPTSLL